MTFSELASIPLLLVGSWLFVADIGNIFCLISGWMYHETGHTIAYWLTGEFALPTPLFTVTEAIPGFAIIVISSGLSAMYLAYRNGYFALASISAVFGLLTPVVIFLPQPLKEQFTTAAGLGGELLLSVLGILLFYAPMPRQFNWSINRWVFAFFGALQFVSSIRLWYNIRFAAGKLPMGAAIDLGLAFGGKSDGDLDRLIRDYGWSSDFIERFYFALSVTSLILLVGGYLLIVAYTFWPKSSEMNEITEPSESSPPAGR